MDTTLPLADLRVLEMGQLLAGPFCAQLLGDFGADVIKCEPPGVGDPMREWGREKPNGVSLWWPILARNKRSITIDLRTADGQDLVRALIPKVDILVENFRPGTLERWGLGYDELAAINPGLILIRVTGFGQNGPYAARPGYGSIGEAMGGLRYVSGDPATPPSRMGVSIGDTLCGTFAALGGLVAVHARHRTGKGQVVDAALYEAVLAVMESLLPEYALAGHIRERTGAILPNVAPSNVYPTADGELVLIAANQDTVFTRLAACMGRPELATDDRYRSHGARGEHQAELDELISAWTATFDTAALEERLDEHAIPMGRIYRAKEMLADPHFAARQSIVELDHPVLGPFPMQNVTPRLTATPGRVRALGPRLGEHNDEVYGDLLGLDEAARQRLRDAGVI
jgi:formyl-CoA transferase